MHKVYHIVLSTCLFSLLGILPVSGRSVSMDDFGISHDGGDCTPALRRCLETVLDDSGEKTTINFGEGTYHFYPDMGYDDYCFISNNDEGLKRIAFLLKDCRDIEIDGHGAQFVFHGFINPFVINRASNVTFKNFTVDCARPFHSEAIISEVVDDGVIVEIPREFPYKVVNGVLLFTDYTDDDKGPATTVSKDQIFGYSHILEFDTKLRETAFMARDYFFRNISLVADDLGDNKVRIHYPGLTGTVGNTLVFGPDHRKYPAFVATDSEDVTFNNVTIHHAGGMGIIGQRVHNVTVDHCKVAPSGSRILSTTADATHFTNCTGKIELSHNVFSNQMDDATNIHGIYVKIKDIPSPCKAIVELCHPQQYGFDFLREGMETELVKGLSLITVGNAKVAKVNRINKNLTEVTFETQLPADIEPGDALCEVREYPSIHIHDNYVGKNRARGMLLNCRGKTVVERNVFHSPGAAILFEGDASFWYEQGGVSDCTIRDNVFDECLFGVWGKAVIDVAAGIRRDADRSRYNRNIKVYGNTFKMFDDALLLHAYGVENLDWDNNVIEKTGGYRAMRSNESLFKVENCDNITINQL